MRSATVVMVAVRKHPDHEPPTSILCAHGAEWFLLSPRERTEVRGKGPLASLALSNPSRLASPALSPAPPVMSKQNS